ncbi:mechanosensitive channel MscS [Klebsiella variicola]|nr:mechanosensitive channel MscS [Klebsiella variicola]
MEDLNVVDSINNAGTWLARNQELLLSYAVNIVAAIVILVIGMIVARIVSNTVNRLMLARKIDATVADFLSALVRYAVIAFTLIAALGRVGVQTASVIAVLGAAGLAVGLALQGSLSNLAAGVLLVMFRPFRAGEYVDLGGIAGTVQNVQISPPPCVPQTAKSWWCRMAKSSPATSLTSPANRRAAMSLSLAYPTMPISTR